KPLSAGYRWDVATEVADNVAVGPGEAIANFDLDAISFPARVSGRSPNGVGLDAASRLHPALLDAWLRDGGSAALGLPYDNGGGRAAHRWDVRGWTQDVRGGGLGTGALLGQDGDARAW